MNTRFGRYTKEGWSDWVDRMLEEHGEPTKGKPPAQGPPAQGPPPSKLKGKADCCMEIADDTDDEKLKECGMSCLDKNNNLLSTVICSN